MHPLECNLNQQTNSIATNLNYHSTSQNTLKSNSFFKTKVKITTSLASCLKYWSKFFLPLRMRSFFFFFFFFWFFWLIYLLIYLFTYLFDLFVWSIYLSGDEANYFEYFFKGTRAKQTTGWRKPAVPKVCRSRTPRTAGK